MIHLYDVTAVYAFKRGGVVLAPGIPVGGPRVSRGDALRLERPDGTQLDTGVEMVESHASEPNKIMLSKSVQKKDVPVGTRVFKLG